MATPPMLTSREAARPAAVRGPDPAAWLAVLLLSLVGVALLVAGTMAVYTSGTPAGEGVAMWVVAILFCAAVALVVTAALVRGVRRGGLF
jgi:hypothetical protein